MARTDNDTWEITESVGATALGVAAARVAETRSENPLISDPFAQVFLDAVGDGVWNWHPAPQLPAELIELEPGLPLQMQSMVSYVASPPGCGCWPTCAGRCTTRRPNCRNGIRKFTSKQAWRANRFRRHRVESQP